MKWVRTSNILTGARSLSSVHIAQILTQFYGCRLPEMWFRYWLACRDMADVISYPSAYGVHGQVAALLESLVLARQL